jgi:hypothetical protein
MVSAAALHRDLGITGPPHDLPTIYALQEPFNADLSQNRNVSGAVTTRHWDGRYTVTLGPLPTREAKREHGAHEFGHIACGHLTPSQPVLYARGKRRGADPPVWVEQEADAWMLEYLVPQGWLGIALRHDGIRVVGQLAAHFLVNPRTIIRAARSYSLGHLLIHDTAALQGFRQSAAWRKFQRAFLLEHDVCENTYCGRPSVVVHHTRYDRYSLMLPEDLRALCWLCHDEEHLGRIYPHQLQLAV